MSEGAESKLSPKFKSIQLGVIITEINSMGKCNYKKIYLIKSSLKRRKYIKNELKTATTFFDTDRII